MSNDVMEKWTMCAPPKDKERYEENGKLMGLSRNAYIRFMVHIGEEYFYKLKAEKGEPL